MIYLNVWLKDDNGNVITDCDKKLTAEVSGAVLIGFGSGDPKPKYNYNEGITETFHGHALLILRKPKENDTCHVKIEAEDGMFAEEEISFL